MDLPLKKIIYHRQKSGNPRLYSQPFWPVQRKSKYIDRLFACVQALSNVDCETRRNVLLKTTSKIGHTSIFPKVSIFATKLTGSDRGLETTLEMCFWVHELRNS